MRIGGTQLSGGFVALLGSVLSVVLVVDAATTPAPTYWLVQTYSVALSLVLTGAGVLLARGRLIDDRYLPRLLAWMVGGVVALSVLLVYLYALVIVFAGNELLDRPVGMVTITTFGALVGLLVGIYDARATERKRALEQLRQVTDTLRITTGELVEQRDREALERTVCERLAESTVYDGAWLGRYDPGAARVRVVAAAGVAAGELDGLELPVEASTPAGRAVETGAVEVFEGDHEGPTAEWMGPGGGPVALVPVVGTEGVYGLLGVAASGFDDRELAVVADLGETVGHAIDSIRARDELVQREAELVAHNDRLDEFASVVSHDLRNPLAVILGRVDFLQEGDDDEHLAAIERAGARMDAIITDLLALSRAERSLDDHTPVPLAAAADEAWDAVETGSATLEMVVPETAAVEADRAQLLRLFENLFRNSVEHNDAPLSVRVDVDGLTAEGESLRGFAVTDDGRGIPADERGEVFDHGYTTNADGTGFGLSIVADVVEAHGWTISVTEGEAGGARFEIRTDG